MKTMYILIIEASEQYDAREIIESIYGREFNSIEEVWEEIHKIEPDKPILIQNNVQILTLESYIQRCNDEEMDLSNTFIVHFSLEKLLITCG